jgi:hypothetical protein
MLPKESRNLKSKVKNLRTGSLAWKLNWIWRGLSEQKRNTNEGKKNYLINSLENSFLRKNIVDFSYRNSLTLFLSC